VALAPHIYQPRLHQRRRYTRLSPRNRIPWRVLARRSAETFTAGRQLGRVQHNDIPSPPLLSCLRSSDFPFERTRPALALSVRVQRLRSTLDEMAATVLQCRNAASFPTRTLAVVGYWGSQLHLEHSGVTDEPNLAHKRCDVCTLEAADAVYAVEDGIGARQAQGGLRRVDAWAHTVRFMRAFMRHAS